MDEAIRKAFTDAWNLYKRHMNMQHEDSDWESLIKDSQNVAKDNNNPFGRDLVNAVMDELERKCKQCGKE